MQAIDRKTSQLRHQTNSRSVHQSTAMLWLQSCAVRMKHIRGKRRRICPSLKHLTLLAICLISCTIIFEPIDSSVMLKISEFFSRIHQIFTISTNSSSSGVLWRWNNLPDVDCQPGVPCEYPDVVDIRIIVLTYDRKDSLLILLNSLNDLYLDGDVGQLEIWIDRNKSNIASEEIVKFARSFHWKQGRVRVNVQKRHVGIIGQWIDTWRPKLSRPEELVLILEDDMTLSPHAYRWLKAAHRFYVNRTDVAGLTLQSESIIEAKTESKQKELQTPANTSVFLYKYVSSWGLAPYAKVWHEFQDWYYSMKNDTKFRPYVLNNISTRWYKIFEKNGTQHSMWTMWFIYHCHNRQLYTLFNNINSLNLTKTPCLAVNRKERGLHYSGLKQKKDYDKSACLMYSSWRDEFIKFNKYVPKLDYDGKLRRTTT